MAIRTRRKNGWGALVVVIVFVVVATVLGGGGSLPKTTPGDGGAGETPYAPFRISPAVSGLTVSILPLWGTVAAKQDSMAFVAVVTSGGLPVSGALVNFSDTFGSTFQPVSSTTNASGDVATLSYFSGTSSGSDTVNATASAGGHSAGYAALTVDILPASGSQLSVLGPSGPLTVQNSEATSGSSDVISGYVRSNCGGTSGCNGIGGVTVSLNDTIGAVFASPVLTTDSNGYFSTSFAVPPTSEIENDFITATASDVGFGGSSSTTFMTVSPPSASALTVALDMIFPSGDETAKLGNLVWLAHVDAGGLPVNGASVSFNDLLGSTFTSASTNSTGWAVTTMFVSGSPTGWDIVTATATEPGFTTGYGSNVAYISPEGTTQLSIYPLSLQNPSAASGSSDVIDGYVRSNCGGANGCNGVEGVTIELSDTLGATFASTQLTSDPTGYFWTNLTLPTTGATAVDFITATATETGYGGTSSAIYANVSPPAPRTLSVTLDRFYPSSSISVTASSNILWLAQVEAGGVPVSGASVDFADTAGSSFTSATTNGTGWALTVMSTGHAGWDIITATATDPDYATGYGSNVMDILPQSSTQLTVTLSVQSVTAISGTRDFVSGYVYTNCGACSPEPGATVGLTDTLGSTFSVPVQVTDSNGYFNTNLTAPLTAGVELDYITATATEIGYASSSASTYLSVGPCILGACGVVFAETGLPLGTLWSVTLGASTQNSTVGNITFAEENGTYSFTVGSMSGYSPTPPSGSVRVAGNIIQVSVSYKAIPVVRAPVPVPIEADVGQSVEFSTIASGGSGTYSTFTWTESSLSFDCSLENVASITCVPTAAGVYTVGVSVTDSNGASSALVTSAEVTVSPDPLVAAPEANRSSVDVGQSLSFSTVASGGTGTFTAYVWTESSPLLGCKYENAPSITCLPAASGTYSVTVSTTDSNGMISIAATSTSVAVSPTLFATAPTANRTSVDVGQSVDFSTVVSGGSGDITYSWTGLPQGCQGSGESIACQPTEAVAGTLVRVTVTDSNDYMVANEPLAFSVYPDPTITDFTASGPGSSVGQTAGFSVTVTGGSGGAVYVWSGLPFGCSGATAAVTCANLTTAGSYAVRVTVTDSDGYSVTSAALPFTVRPAQTSAPTGGLSEVDVDVAIGVAAAAIAGSVGFVMGRRQKPAARPASRTPP